MERLQIHQRILLVEKEREKLYKYNDSKVLKLIINPGIYLGSVIITKNLLQIPNLKLHFSMVIFMRNNKFIFHMVKGEAIVTTEDISAVMKAVIFI